jgi:hypothetical protein
MSNPRRSRRAAGSRTVDEDTPGQDAASALEENVQAIERWEAGSCPTVRQPVRSLPISLPDDLQIDLLAEREMTAVLQLLQDTARHLDVETTVTSEQLRDLMKKTDLRRPDRADGRTGRTRGACRLDKYGRGLLRGLRVVAK